jgi:macrophage erythroblast attacher
VRLIHLQDLSHTKNQDAPEFWQWSRIRLQRVLLDYLLRQGFMTSAKMLVECFEQARNFGPSAAELQHTETPPKATVGGLVASQEVLALAPSTKDMTITADLLRKFSDFEFFNQAKKIEVALENESCTEALAWCADNRTNLKKMKVIFILCNAKISDCMNLLLTSSFRRAPLNLI